MARKARASYLSDQDAATMDRVDSGALQDPRRESGRETATIQRCKVQRGFPESVVQWLAVLSLP